MKRNCDETLETLADYVDGKLEGEGRARLESHLATDCQQCQQTLGWLSRTINVMRNDTSLAPPRPLMNRAVKLLKERKPQSKRTVASLFFDSLFGTGLQSSLVGVRSGPTMTRQVLYGTEELDVDLLIEEAEAFELAFGLPPLSRVNLMGQVLRRSGKQDGSLNYDIAIMRGHECVFCGRTSPLGEFTVDNLSSDSYELQVSGEDGGLVIEGLELKTSKP
ncbi:MAG: zf-HC2 domain-containing protein [Chloroflexi bacterium]|nr:zf-HC2 domain-containing protein [Chloroflexota bacterium]